MTSLRYRGPLAALALTLMAAPALAQTRTPPDMAARHQQMQAMMAEHRAAKSRDLHTLLNIRPDQEAAFAAFQSSMVRPPRDRRPHDGTDGEREKMAGMTTPQRLDLMQARMDEHVARMHAHIQATKAFYAALSPQQQQAFDALARMHGMHGGGHGMHGGWEGHGPHMGGPEGPSPPPGA